MSRRRSKAERGLPSKKLLTELAECYLTIQRKHWTKLRRSGLFPQPTKDNLTGMANAFRDGFLEKKPPALWRDLDVLEFSAIYLRYSSDKSNPRSLVQQLKRALTKANDHGHFVPWSYVFADAAVSGTTPFRTGYEMTKAVLEDGEASCIALYIDEIGRASRNMIEALQLGLSIEKNGQAISGSIRRL